MDELSKSIPGAEGMVEAEQSANPKQHNENCLNCGTKLVDTFCHHCGQKDIPKRQTLVELWINFISSFWSYEGKFLLTTRYLITKPGFLALEYNAGRRESYYHPARMYAFISFVFFLVFFSIPDHDDFVKISSDDTTEAAGKPEEVVEANLDSSLAFIPLQDSSIKQPFSKPWLDSIKLSAKKNKGKGFRLGNLNFETVAAYDSAQLTKPEGERDGWAKHKLKTRLIELNKRYANNANSFTKDFGEAFIGNFSKMLFFLLPVFALVLKLLYVRKDYFYSEHLVFSIYYYNFFYLVGSLQVFVNLVPHLGWVSTIMGFWIFFYLLFAMKRMYQQSWRKTIFKFLLFSFVFSLFAMIGFVINALVILLIL